MNKRKDERWLDNQLRRAIHGDMPQFDAQAWKQKHPEEYQELVTRGNQPVGWGLPHRDLAGRRLWWWGRLAVAAAIITAIGLFVLNRSENEPEKRIVPPDPDNAALLYYQAFLTVADLDKDARDHIAEVARGKLPPDEKTRQYISDCRGAIDFAAAAQDLQLCHWGFRYSQGFDALMPQLAQMRFLSYVLLADARLHAADGDYRAALDRCLMMGPLSRHVGDDTLISYLVSVAVRRIGFECMEDMIGRAAGDAELLQWLKEELATSEKDPAFPITALKIEREICLATMTMDDIESLARMLANSDDSKRQQILAAANEQTMAEARRIYSDNLSSALAVLSSAMPYEQAYRQLKRLGENFDPGNPLTAAVAGLVPATAKVVTIKTTQEAHANAARAAVDICLHRARTGSLPATLPAGLPKDPFSGQDFQYERTARGFVLRCQGKDLDKGTIQEFEFTIQ